MEDNLVQKESANEGISIRDILLILKSHLVLMLVIVLTFTAVGVAYTFTQKPEYTVTQKLGYRCENKPYEDSSGELIDLNNTVANTNTMLAYGDTIVDFFDEGVVLDRANYYYGKYLEKKNISKEDGELYLENLKTKASGNLKDTEYASNQEEITEHIDDARISTSNMSSSSETVFTFTVSYTAPTVEEAREKLMITVYAFSMECKETKEVNNEDKIKYFGEFTVIISDLGEEGVGSNLAKTKTVVTFGAIGVVAALAVVFILHLLDNTVKDKKQLEKLVGAPTLAAVQKWED